MSRCDQVGGRGSVVSKQSGEGRRVEKEGGGGKEGGVGRRKEVGGGREVGRTRWSEGCPSDTRRSRQAASIFSLLFECPEPSYKH